MKLIFIGVDFSYIIMNEIKIYISTGYYKKIKTTNMFLRFFHSIVLKDNVSIEAVLISVVDCSE